MSLVDALTFVAGLLFLLISSRQRSKRRQAGSVDEELQTAFEQEESAQVEWDYEQEELLLKKNSSHKANSATRYPVLPNRCVKPRYQANQGKRENVDAFNILPYAPLCKARSARAFQVLASLKSSQEMVILHEIFSPPKGL